MEPAPETPSPSRSSTSPLPPTSIPRQPHTHLHLPLEYTSPTALRLPTTWRCGTCASLNPIPSLLRTTAADVDVHCPCPLPSLQAVYDQFGALYLFWRDDPAVSDLRVPGMLEEARWRVWRAGGGEWGFLLGRELGDSGMEGEGDGDGERGRGETDNAGEDVEGSLGSKKELGINRRWSDASQSSSASDESGE